MNGDKRGVKIYYFIMPALPKINLGEIQRPMERLQNTPISLLRRSLSIPFGQFVHRNQESYWRTHFDVANKNKT
jgi:hypothetical protein